MPRTRPRNDFVDTRHCRKILTDNNVKPVRKTSLAIKTGSRKSEVKLSPCILSSSIPSAVFGKASLERMLPTDAVT